MESKMIRVFFALTLPDEMQQSIVQVQMKIKKAYPTCPIQWSAPKNLHITLKFFSAIESLLIPLLIEKVTDAVKRLAPMHLTLGRLSLFPSPEEGKCIVFHVLHSDALEQLVQKIEEASAALQLPSNQQPFCAHVTIAKIKKMHRFDNRLPSFPKKQTLDFEVFEMHCFESRGTEEGSQYYSLGKIPIGKEDEQKV